MASSSTPSVHVPATQKPQDDTQDSNDSIESTQATPEEEMAENTPEPIHNIESSQMVLEEVLAKSGEEYSQISAFGEATVWQRAKPLEPVEKAMPDELKLSIRHFARRPGVSASQLNVLQDVLLKGTRVIKQSAFRQEVFRNVLVVVHALGWLYIRVGALSDGAKRRSALIQTWNDLSAWMLTSNAASDILRQVYATCLQSFEEGSGASEEVLSIGTDDPDILDSSNSALEGSQWLVADLAVHTAAWRVGDSMRVFGQADVSCVDYNAALCEIVLRFRDSEVEICLCRQVDRMVHVAEWVQNLVGDEYFRYIMD